MTVKSILRADLRSPVISRVVSVQRSPEISPSDQIMPLCGGEMPHFRHILKTASAATPTWLGQEQALSNLALLSSQEQIAPAIPKFLPFIILLHLVD
jgi:hypothetical protein